MRVLHVITDTDRRGAQVFALDLQDALRRLGHDSATVAMATGDQQPALGVDVLGPSRYHPTTIRELRNRMAGADITVGHGSDTLLACAAAGVGPGRPFVYRQISDTRFWTRGWSRRLRVAALMRAARHVIALSETDRRDLHEHLRLADSRITVIPNGVPVDGFSPATPEQRTEAKTGFGIDPDTFVLLGISALVPEKGVDIAIRAAAAIDGCRLLIVGDGAERAALERLAADVAPDKVTFTGALDEPSQAYRAADVVVLPSLGGDTMPATLIEAGLCELPSVATPIGAIEEVVLHGRTGFIVPPGNVAETAEAVQTLRDDPASAAAIGLAAHDHCTHTFGIDRVSQQWVDALSDVVAESGT